MIIRFDDPVQQEIRATVRALNDAWTKGKPSIRLGAICFLWLRKMVGGGLWLISSLRFQGDRNNPWRAAK
jgi:hypothetical protein